MKTALAFSALLWGAPVVALASAHARLHYTPGKGAERCPDEAAVRGAVAVRLGYDPFNEPATRLVEVEIRSAQTRSPADGLVAAIKLSDIDGQPLGERSFSSTDTDCRELTEAFTLAIAIALDPVSATRPPPAAVSAKSAPPVLLVGAGVLGSVGSAAQPALGFNLELDARWPHVSLGLAGRVDLPAGISYEGGSVQTNLLVGELIPCLWESVFALCGVVAIGTQEVQAQGLPQISQQSPAYVALGGRGAMELPIIGPLALRLTLELLAQATRINVQVGPAVVISEPPISGEAALGVVVRFQ